MWGQSSLVHERLVRIELHQAFCSLSQGLCGWGGRIPNILQLLIWKPFLSCEYFRYFVLVLKPHQKHKANFNFWLNSVPGAVKRVAAKQALFMGGLETQPCKWWWGGTLQEAMHAYWMWFTSSSLQPYSFLIKQDRLLSAFQMVNMVNALGGWLFIRNGSYLLTPTLS